MGSVKQHELEVSGLNYELNQCRKKIARARKNRERFGYAVGDVSELVLRIKWIRDELKKLDQK
jgi:hypothetical protein